MRVGVVTDGRSEKEALPILLGRLTGLPNLTLVGVALAAVSATDPIGTIARSVDVAITSLMKTRRAERVVLLVDRENRSTCPGDFATQVREEILRKRNLPASDMAIAIVIKDRMLENWLVAAIPSLPTTLQRFQVSASDLRSIQPHKADHVNALD